MNTNLTDDEETYFDSIKAFGPTVVYSLVKSEGADMGKAFSAVSSAAMKIDKKWSNLLSFFTSTVRNDDSYESVTYRFVGDTSHRSGVMLRTITYIDGRTETAHGPLMPTEVGEEFADMLTKLANLR
ncbi:MAG: hypothetical protein WC284_17345 [Candidimonas sp.]